MLEIPQVVEIMKKCGLSSKTEINNMLNMARRNDTSVGVITKIPIREDWRKKRYQTSKYTILKNGAYYVHHDWDKKQKVRGKVALPCPRYGHDGCGLKLVVQTFIYKILLKRKRRGVEVDLDVIWLTIQVGKEKLNLIQKLKEESRNKALSGF